MENYRPDEIEMKSFQIISEELGDIKLDTLKEPIIKRVIHTTADFDYVKSLCFSENAVEMALEAIKKGADFVTDTQMVRAGISKLALKKSGGDVHCFMSDQDVADEAALKGVTRATICMEKAAAIKKPVIIAIGNAPTALVRLSELIKTKEINPVLVIGVPVGFVNVVESKEIIMNSGAPFIVAKGRKGGSNVAASIVNALLYMAYPR
ncbi:UNVERIFIED_CONTAM: precorrin-8X methylmutase [Acetivibrio alkalicellulosi]